MKFNTRRIHSLLSFSLAFRVLIVTLCYGTQNRVSRLCAAITQSSERERGRVKENEGELVIENVLKSANTFLSIASDFRLYCKRQ